MHGQPMPTYHAKFYQKSKRDFVENAQCQPYVSKTHQPKRPTKIPSILLKFMLYFSK
ncbi:Uncharacterised protein [Moraxella atlantae]|uniref:Uncharacterized protein n=1 Tax=Faucicola atlantae TaxID=34059 RepID=A0A378Q5D6_9GAMM|nr:Uncharacterised protein [Moraxella atlantae]